MGADPKRGRPAIDPDGPDFIERRAGKRGLDWSMLGAGIIMPFIAAAVGALFGMQVSGQPGIVTGGAIGFAVGCAVLAFIWALFAILKRWAGD